MKKTGSKTSITPVVTFFPKQSKNPRFRPICRGSYLSNLLKNRPNPRPTLKPVELCKYRCYVCLTGIDVKLKHRRFAPCKKPRRKTHIRELLVFPKQSENRRFRPIWQGSYLSNLRKNRPNPRPTLKHLELCKCRAPEEYFKI